MNPLLRAVTRVRSLWNLRGLDAGTLEMLMRSSRYDSGDVVLNSETVLNHSGVWAARRLRANMMAALPVSVRRNVSGIDVETSLPYMFESPYPGVRFDEWVWGTQFDLDGYGNTVGIVHAVNGYGRPSVIEPVDLSLVSFTVNGSEIKRFMVNGEKINLKYLSLETQYRRSGCPMGMSPLQHAAESIRGYLSAQRFATGWFSKDRALPRGTLRNTMLEIPDPDKTELIKSRFRAATRDGDIFVTGRDWEWTPHSVDVQQAGFIEQFRWGIIDVCRFLDVPGFMVDAIVPGGSMTYTNVTQEQLKFMVNNFGPSVWRRERWFSQLLPPKRTIHFDVESILRMDPESQGRILNDAIKNRRLTPNEARARMNMPPFTQDQISEFYVMFPKESVVSAPGSSQADGR